MVSINSYGPNVYEISRDMQANNLQLLEEKMEKYYLNKGPQVGDFCIMPDGEYVRLTYDWGDKMQTTVKSGHLCYGDQSFFLSKQGRMSFSGSLEDSIKKLQLKLTEEVRPGRCWFFESDYVRPHSAVHCIVDLPVWRYNDGNKDQ